MIDVRLTRKCAGPEQRRHVFCSNKTLCNNKASRTKTSLFVRMSEKKQDVPDISEYNEMFCLWNYADVILVFVVIYL